MTLPRGRIGRDSHDVSLTCARGRRQRRSRDQYDQRDLATLPKEGPYASILYHGSPTWGLTELRSANELGVEGVHRSGQRETRGGGWGIYLTHNRIEAEMYAGDGGAIYEVSLNADWCCPVTSYEGYISKTVYDECRLFGIDCLRLVNFLDYVIVINADCIKITRTLPAMIDEVRDDLRAFYSILDGGAAQSLEALAASPVPKSEKSGA